MNGLKKTLSIMLCVAMIASGSFMAFAEGESNPQNVTVVEGENAGENVGGEEGGNEGNEGENVDENKEENKDEDKQQSEALLAAIGALNSLPLFDSLTEDTDADALLAQVQAAREAYDALTEEEKLLVEEAKLNNLLDLEFFFENRPSNTPADAPVDQVVATQNVAETAVEDGAFEVEGTKYATLAEAIAAVKEGGIITLTSNVDNAEGIAVDEGKNFTIDFGGHTYTVKTPGAGSPNTETNAFQLLKDSTITMKNGTIRISADNKQNGDKKPIMRIIQNYANLTLENMTFYAQNQAGGEDYPLSFNNGNIVFKGNTSIITSSDSNIAFDVCKFSSYPSTTVTFDESYTGTINGKIVYDATDASTHKLTINGNGTFGKIEASSKGEEAAKDAIEVSGGRFTAPVNKDYLADGYHYQLYSNDRYYSYHPTLEDAKNAAKPEGGTITDLNNPTQKPVVVPPSPNAPEKPNSNSGSTGSSSTVQQMEEREKPDPADKKAMEEYNFWMQVKSKIRATAEGKTLRITVKEGIEYMPASVMQTLYECKVGITLYWDGVTIEIPVGKAQPKQALRVYWTKTKLMDLYNA